MLWKNVAQWEQLVFPRNTSTSTQLARGISRRENERDLHLLMEEPRVILSHLEVLVLLGRVGATYPIVTQVLSPLF